MEYFWILLIVAVASLIKGITGFGFALVSLPFLMIWYPPKEVVPVLVLCNLCASIIIVLQKKERNLIRQQFRWLIVWGGLFTVLGVMALGCLPEKLLIDIMGVFFILLSFFSFFGTKKNIKLRHTSYKIAGMFLGFLTGSISVSGPPLALFLHFVNVDNQEFREIFSWFSIVTATIALLGYAFLGVLTFWTFKMAFMFLPIIFLGSFFGKKLNYHVPALFFKKIISLITLISSILLLLK